MYSILCFDVVDITTTALLPGKPTSQYNLH